jgi:hypothetical protein
LLLARPAVAAPVPILVVASRYQFTPGGPDGPPILLNAGTTYEITFRAGDVEHGVSAIPRLGIPALDLVPGRDQTVTVAPTLDQVGRYNFACIRVCGAGHGDMHGAIEVDIEDSSALRLMDGRFLVAAAFRASDGATNLAHPVLLASDSGDFWFFQPDNLELVVKILDGCGLNGRFWFFATGLTNVEVSLFLEDTLGGDSRTYASAAGVPFASIQDVDAFGSCP